MNEFLLKIFVAVFYPDQDPSLVADYLRLSVQYFFLVAQHKWESVKIKWLILRGYALDCLQERIHSDRVLPVRQMLRPIEPTDREWAISEKWADDSRAYLASLRDKNTSSESWTTDSPRQDVRARIAAIQFSS